MNKHPLLEQSAQSFKKNLLPGICLQIVAVTILLVYFFAAPARPVFDAVESLKKEYGFLFSALSTALSGAVIPFLVMLALGRIARKKAASEFVFLVILWMYKGVEVDLLYRLQALMFGAEPGFWVVFKKVLVDQFVYSAFWSGPSLTIIYLWRDNGFSFARTRAAIDRRFLTLTIPSLVISLWMIWIPSVTVIYLLPSALQIPMFTIVQCFWSLFLGVFAGSSEKDV